MSEIVQLYKNEEKTIKVYPKTLASEVYVDENTNIISQLEQKTSKVETQNLQTQVNNLVLGAVGSGNNAEVIQARGNYSVLNARVDDMVKVEVLKASKNLFNTKDIIDGKALSYFGGDRLPVLSNNTGKAIIYTPVIGGETYTVSWTPKGDGDSMTIAQVDVDKKQVSGINISYTTDFKTITLNANCKYIMLSVSKNHFNDIQIEKGSSVTNYEKYFDTVYVSNIYNDLNTRKTLKNEEDISNIFTSVNEINKIIKNTTDVVCWGDSLTWGAGADTNTTFSKYTYPVVLGSLLGDKYNVKNYGIGGENASMIGARQGAYPYIVEPFTIQADTTKVEIKIKTLNGVSAYPLKQTEWGTGVNTGKSLSINPCVINGVEGTITADETIANYYFNRNIVGESVIVKRPTPILTNAHLNNRESIQIIWIGTNGGYNSEEELIRIIKSMKDNTDLSITKYIVIGLTYKVATTLDVLMNNEFGRHFINVRDYITTPIYDVDGITIKSCYGLDDLGITPTTNDLTAISQRKIPQSLLFDDVHFNISGYNIVTNLVYKRGQELMYW